MSEVSSLSRRTFLGAAAGTAAAGALGPVAGPALAGKRGKKGKHSDRCEDGDLQASAIGIQLFTVRNLLDDASLDLPGTFEMLSDAGYRTVEVGGTYDGRTPAEFRQLAKEENLKVIGSHVPGGHGAWRSNLGLVLDEAEALDLPYVGIASPANDVPHTVDGYKAMAEEFNAFGRAARERGIKFYFHNHPPDFTIDNGTVIYDVLLEETDRRYVWFELDIAWIDAGGQSAREYVKADPSRYPLFHVKDLKYSPDGARVTPDGVAGAGRRFDLTDVGKGEIDFARIFSALRKPDDHEYLVEHDDAPSPEANPAGAANTSWFSRRYLGKLDLK